MEKATFMASSAASSFVDRHDEKFQQDTRQIVNTTDHKENCILEPKCCNFSSAGSF
jgi:hypothetical protein